MITVLFTVNIDLKPARIFFPRIASRWISNNIAFILSFFRNVVSESNQIDSLKNAQDDPKDSNCRYKMAVLEKDGNA